jgi:hypothetical protein
VISRSAQDDRAKKGSAEGCRTMSDGMATAFLRLQRSELRVWGSGDGGDQLVACDGDEDSDGLDLQAL